MGLAKFIDNLDYKIFYLKGHEDNNFLKMMQIKDINNYLPDDILTKVDRTSMAHSLNWGTHCLIKDYKFVGINNN